MAPPTPPGTDATVSHLGAVAQLDALLQAHLHPGLGDAGAPAALETLLAATWRAILDDLGSVDPSSVDPGRVDPTGNNRGTGDPTRTPRHDDAAILAQILGDTRAILRPLVDTAGAVLLPPEGPAVETARTLLLWDRLFRMGEEQANAAAGGRSPVSRDTPGDQTRQAERLLGEQFQACIETMPDIDLRQCMGR